MLQQAGSCRAIAARTYTVFYCIAHERDTARVIRAGNIVVNIQTNIGEELNTCDYYAYTL